jgi:hypothetical protein
MADHELPEVTIYFLRWRNQRFLDLIIHKNLAVRPEATPCIPGEQVSERPPEDESLP